MEPKRGPIWPGVVLILVGSWILVTKLHLFNLSSHDTIPILLAGGGLWFFFRAFETKNEGLVFPGTLLFLLGIYHIVKWHFLDRHAFYYAESWIVYVIIIGLAFLVQYFFRPKDWGLLIPAFILLFIGGRFLFESLDWYLPIEFRIAVSRYWPVLLIIIGVLIILSGLFKKEARQ